MLNRGNNIRIIYAFVAALLFNAVAPALASASDSNQGVLVCTSSGYQWVKIEQQTEQGSTAKAGHCVWCALLDQDDQPNNALHLTTKQRLLSEQGIKPYSDYKGIQWQFLALLPDNRSPPTI